MDGAERDCRVFRLAMEFISDLRVPGVTLEIVDSYLHPIWAPERADEIAELYQRLLETAQNANMKAGVIGKAIGGVQNLAPVLFDFDPSKVLSNYRNWEEVLDKVEQEVKPRGMMRRTSRSIWPHFCRTVLSAAHFLTRFSSADAFHNWVRFFDEDDRARPALPMLLEREIDGVGFALACDFLKEIGYLNFAKPDIHIKDIFEKLQLASSRKDYDVFRAIIRVAAAVHETPYCVDKLFWLIGSGYFYDHPGIGKNGRIGRRKAEFFAFVLPRLT